MGASFRTVKEQLFSEAEGMGEKDKAYQSQAHRAGAGQIPFNNSHTRSTLSTASKEGRSAGTRSWEEGTSLL